jgi:hypothetical protein
VAVLSSSAWDVVVYRVHDNRQVNVRGDLALLSHNVAE